jgi:selenoprotein W-related protein
VSLTADLLQELQPRVTSWELVPSSGGRFEVSLDGELLYSKLKVGRFPDTDEVRKLLQAKL